MDAPIFMAQLAVIALLGVCLIALAIVEDLREVRYFPADYFTIRDR